MWFFIAAIALSLLGLLLPIRRTSTLHFLGLIVLLLFIVGVICAYPAP